MRKRTTERDLAAQAGRRTYFTGKPCKAGHVADRFVSNYGCVTCQAARQDQEYQKAYKAKNKDRIAENFKRYYASKGPEIRAYNRERYRKNFDKISAYHKQRYPELRVQKSEYLKDWYARNRGRIEAYREAHYRENRHLYIARARARQAAVIDRTPAWADLDHIRDIYELARIANECTGFCFHVDHIVPVSGERVSGLHVPANLNVILAEHNLLKRNKFDLEGAAS